jgi:hypothetical protein
LFGPPPPPGLATLCFGKGTCTGQPPLLTSIKVCAPYYSTLLFFNPFLTPLYSVGERTSARRKGPTRTLSRIPTNKATSKRIYRYKAITKERKELKHTETKVCTRNYRTKAECKTGNQCVQLLYVIEMDVEWSVSSYKNPQLYLHSSHV